MSAHAAYTGAALLEAWRAWACPVEPSSMRDEPALALLRERWPLDGGGEGPGDYAALLRAQAAPREEQRPADLADYRPEPTHAELVALFPDDDGREPGGAG